MFCVSSREVELLGTNITYAFSPSYTSTVSVVVSRVFHTLYTTRTMSKPFFHNPLLYVLHRTSIAYIFLVKEINIVQYITYNRPKSTLLLSYVPTKEKETTTNQPFEKLKASLVYLLQYTHLPIPTNLETATTPSVCRSRFMAKFSSTVMLHIIGVALEYYFFHFLGAIAISLYILRMIAIMLHILGLVESKSKLLGCQS